MAKIPTEVKELQRDDLLPEPEYEFTSLDNSTKSRREKNKLLDLY